MFLTEERDNLPIRAPSNKANAHMPTQSTRRGGGSDTDFLLEDSPGHLLHRAQQRAADMTAQALRAQNLTPRQFAVLMALSQNEGVTQSELVRRTGVDRSTLADMLARLSKRRLVITRRTEQDQRANAVRITAEGQRTLDEAAPKVIDAEKRIVDLLPADQRENFLVCLKTLADSRR